MYLRTLGSVPDATVRGPSSEPATRRRTTMRFKTPVQALRAAAIALAFLIATPRLVAEDKKADDKASPEEAVLKSGEGTWDATVKSMGGESKATMTCKVGVGGKWAIEHFKGEFGGMPFEGRGATSYDPEKKKYINVWIDSMSANVMVSEGTYDKKTKTLTFVGKMPTPDGK